ncbi:hypothetical protein FDECE_18312 [Fusarium decemcellulare]|nr:hypothetical protein FDECE_18312 [Fusarium decemcellulare]
MEAHHPIPLIDPPSNPQSLGSDFPGFLQQFQQFENAPYVHPRAISFNDATHRANWTDSMQDATQRDTLIEFYISRKEGRKTWIGFFSGETTNWINDPDWEIQPWHCFTIEIIQDPSRGKHMVVGGLKWEISSGRDGKTHVLAAASGFHMFEGTKDSFPRFPPMKVILGFNEAVACQEERITTDDLGLILIPLSDVRLEPGRLETAAVDHARRDHDEATVEKNVAAAAAGGIAVPQWEDLGGAREARR